MIDLHVHSTASDGTDSPAELVAAAKEIGLSAIAVTDHDTTAGLAEAIQAGRQQGLRVLPGIELAARFEGQEIHILGYGFEPASRALLQAIGFVIKAREERNRRMAQAITGLGCTVDYDEMLRRFPDAVIARPHFAQVLIERGFSDSYQAAFQDYLNPGRPGYVARELLTIPQAVTAIHDAHGLAVLAHPLQYKFPEGQFQRFLDASASAGMDGLETYYTGYTPEQVNMLARTAVSRGWLVTGGSDYHGARKPQIHLGFGDGNLAVDDQILAELDRALERLKSPAGS